MKVTLRTPTAPQPEPKPGQLWRGNSTGDYFLVANYHGDLKLVRLTGKVRFGVSSISHPNFSNISDHYTLVCDCFDLEIEE